MRTTARWLALLLKPSCIVALLGALTAAPAGAVDADWSGFASLGYAVSDSPYTYQGSINNRGTLRRDSLVGGQLDLRLSQAWFATLQGEVSPADDSDSAWRGRMSWAFVGWRPDDDWLVRAGKVRVPLYLHSESLDVGVATDMARLPYEMYSITPTNDFSGLFVTRNLSWGDSEFSADVFAGSASATARLWLRDGLPPLQPAGPLFTTVHVDLKGLVLTQRDSKLTTRIGLMATATRRADGQAVPVSYPRVDIAPGLGYWQVYDSLPGPGIPTVDRIHNLILTAGAEWQFADTWRVAAEMVRMRQFNTTLGSDSHAGYIALFKQFGPFTPYLSVAHQRSNGGLLQWRTELLGHGLPPTVPGADQINALQRVTGESVLAYDQSSLALGLSFALNPNAKLKAEWMATRVGQTSAHFDTPAGRSDPRGLVVNTLSLNFSVAF